MPMGPGPIQMAMPKEAGTMATEELPRLDGQHLLPLEELKVIFFGSKLFRTSHFSNEVLKILCKC